MPSAPQKCWKDIPVLDRRQKQPMLKGVPAVVYIHAPPPAPPAGHHAGAVRRQPAVHGRHGGAAADPTTAVAAAAQRHPWPRTLRPPAAAATRLTALRQAWWSQRPFHGWHWLPLNPAVSRPVCTTPPQPIPASPPCSALARMLLTVASSQISAVMGGHPLPLLSPTVPPRGPGFGGGAASLFGGRLVNKVLCRRSLDTS